MVPVCQPHAERPIGRIEYRYFALAVETHAHSQRVERNRQPEKDTSPDEPRLVDAAFAELGAIIVTML